MKMIQITLQERWAASQSRVHKSKKQYSRKDKHRKGSQKGPFPPYVSLYFSQGGRVEGTDPSTLPILLQNQALKTSIPLISYLKIVNSPQGNKLFYKNIFKKHEIKFKK